MTSIKSISILLAFFTITTHAFAMNGRFGLGFSNQPETNLEPISFKIHTSKRSAYGGLIGTSNSDTGGYVMGVKLYRKLIQEENLNFFGSIYVGYRNEGPDGGETSGFQGDLTAGVEYFFSGLDHIGFSFETGITANNFDGLIFKTKILNSVQGAIHFYL